MIVTFIGHRDAPQKIRQQLYRVLTELIENCGADVFYVGDKGNFDAMVLSLLCELKLRYAYIDYQIVLSALPNPPVGDSYSDNTIFPEEIAIAPPRFRIDRRNLWMLKQSEVVIIYMENSFGRTAKFRRKAVGWNKRIIDLLI